MKSMGKYNTGTFIEIEREEETPNKRQGN